MPFWDDIGGGEEAAPIPHQEGHTYAGAYGSNPVWGGRGNDIKNGRYVLGTDAASEDVNRYRGLGEAAANRSAYEIDYTRANQGLTDARNDLGAAYGDRNRAGAARQQQLGAVGEMQRAAMGQAPSRAETLGRSMIDQSLQAQLAGAASARGGAMAQAAAMRQAQQGAAGFQAQGAQQLAALRADEMERARGAWMQGASGIRAQDYAGAQQATGMAQTSTGMAQTAAQMQQAQAQSELTQRQLNQQGQQFYEGKGFDTRTAQLNADLQGAAMEQGGDQFRAGMELKRDEQVYNMAGAGIGAGATMGASLVGRKARGGPVASGKPYLVGEEGPELIVPTRDGHVMPAQQTAHVMGLAEAARLKGQAEGMIAGMQGSLAGGSSLAAAPRVINLSPVEIDDDPEEEPKRPAMAEAALMGGRDDPYEDTPRPRLMGGREDPYGPSMRAPR